jgi:hypothetical protein
MNREEDRERGAKGRGNEGLEEIIHRGNKGGQMGKNGRGRVEERGEHGVVASVRIGHLDPMTRYANKPNNIGVADPAYT